ncbi:unnamed protein product [Lampetra planeri]
MGSSQQAAAQRRVMLCPSSVDSLMRRTLTVQPPPEKAEACEERKGACVELRVVTWAESGRVGPSGTCAVPAHGSGVTLVVYIPKGGAVSDGSVCTTRAALNRQVWVRRSRQQQARSQLRFTKEAWDVDTRRNAQYQLRRRSPWRSLSCRWQTWLTLAVACVLLGLVPCLSSYLNRRYPGRPSWAPSQSRLEVFKNEPEPLRSTASDLLAISSPLQSGGEEASSRRGDGGGIDPLGPSAHLRAAADRRPPTADTSSSLFSGFQT